MDKTNHNRLGTSVGTLVRLVERGPTTHRFARAHHTSKDRYRIFDRQAAPPMMTLRAVVDACAANIAVLDEAGTIILVNKAWRLLAEQHRLTAERFGVGHHYLRLCQDVWGVSAEGAAAVAEGIRRLLAGEEMALSQKHRWHSPKFPAAPRWLMMQAARFDLPGLGGAARILVTHLDITECKQTEEALRQLGGRLISAQEEERRRVALELHDDLNQRMAILAIGLDQLGQKIPEGQCELRAGIRDLWTKSQEISAEIHRLSYQLHPAKLDHLGLPTAVQSFCDELSRHHEIKLEFRHRGFPASLPKEVTLCLFRIVQESLNNVIKHSGSRAAQVSLEIAGPQICLSVSDAGCGFDAASSPPQNGLGLISMQERVRRVGGEITICAQPSRGTQITVSIPLSGPLEEL
jgi:signal transduction histidine kinase